MLTEADINKRVRGWFVNSVNEMVWVEGRLWNLDHRRLPTDPYKYFVREDGGAAFWLEEAELVEEKPPENPKKKFGAQKPDLSLCPASAAAKQALAQEDGAKKYGPFNWRENKVEAMTYIAAAKRHLDAWLDGEENTSDTDVPNLGAVMACCAILIDAQECGTLVDNRPPKGPASRVHDELREWKRKQAEKA